MGQTQTAEGVLREAKAKLTGKVAIVTGASAGIGIETARVLVKGGARVFLACRGKEKTEAALKTISESLKSEKEAGTAEFLELDLMDLDSVRSCAKTFLGLNIPLHYLVCNAGIMATPFRKSKQGYESQFATNHLGHFLLTNLLLEKLKESAPSRVVVVSSMAHKSGQIHWDGFLADGKGYSPFPAYGQSKLANILFAAELDRRLEAEAKEKGLKARVTAHSLHPGVIKTELTRDTAAGKAFVFVATPFLKSIPQGAATTVYCCLSPDLENSGGKYYSDCAVARPIPAAESAEDAKKLWEASEKLVGLKATDETKEKVKEEKETKDSTEETSERTATEKEKTYEGTETEKDKSSEGTEKEQSFDKP